MPEQRTNTEHQATAKTRLLRVNGQEYAYADDQLAREEPLEIRVRSREKGKLATRTISITMRTPGEDEALALGFLYSEGLLLDIRQVAGIEAEDNKIVIAMTDGYELPKNAGARGTLANSSCGTCGRTELDDLNLGGCEAIAKGQPRLTEKLITALPDQLREAQAVFESTGGLHACGLFSPEGKLIGLSEDIGRHNALDKLIGKQLAANKLPDERNVLLLSGRIGFEMAQKAVRARIPVLLAIGAPSSLAVEVADRFGLTLVGFLKGDRYNIYTHPERVARAGVSDALAGG